MAEGDTVVAALTLPPKVEGKVSGHLVMKVDEVLWARKPPGDVSAVVMWWGGEQATTFRPTDVSVDALKRKNAGVIYEVRTSLVLFEKYLKKCGSLEIAMADKFGMAIGCASVPGLCQIISNSPYQGYYPIINNFGNRIGDLHVSLNLLMFSSSNSSASVLKVPKAPVIKTKELKLKRLSPGKGKQTSTYARTKDEKTLRNEKVLKDTFGNQEVASAMQRDLGNEDSLHDFRDDKVNNGKENHKRESPTSNIISQILEHGTKLRDAMAASVMEDGLQISCKNSLDLNLLSALPETCPQNVLKSGHNNCSSVPIGSPLISSSRKPSQKRVNHAVEQKVRDYLSGKPMSVIEEKEALAALRSMTPTKDILDDVVPDTLQIFQEKSSESGNMASKESSEIVTNITDYVGNPACDSKSSFDVDSQLLSKINCIRITVNSLVLNSVGIRRTGSIPKKKSGLSQSDISAHPPGVTYFVEYLFSLSSGSRPWESSVRYCSKRISGHEVAFGDRTVHNLPATWRNSISEEANVGSLISSLTFKVCARHLHQRVTIPLGSGTPELVKELIESPHLRHDFDLPVMGSDHLPVGQLRICLELGRDRIHFGGLFDPDNNSLGIRSPRKTSASSNKAQSLISSRKKSDRKVTTVIRNIASKSSVPHRVPLQRASQADRVIKQLVENASVDMKSHRSLDSCSAPSTGRSQPRPSSSKYPFKNQAFPLDFKFSSTKPTVMDRKFLKHEVALTILQVLGKNYLSYSTADDKGFYLKYKFPAFDALKNDSVEWHSFSTEPSENVDGSWREPQNRVHSAILPINSSYITFLQHAFKLHEHSLPNKFVVFTLCVRCYGTEVQDLPVAEAILPFSYLITLEEVYNEAARSNPKFSLSSCASIVLELPFQLLPSYQNEEAKEEQGSLRLKVDYRHSLIENSLPKSNLPRSRGDSVSENFPNYDLGPRLRCVPATEGGVNLGQCLNSPDTVPNWARSPEKPFPQRLRSDEKSHNEETMGFSRLSTNAERKLQAAWEPVEDYCKKFQSSGRVMNESAYLPSSSHRSEGYKSIVDLIDDNKGDGHIFVPQGIQQLSHMDSRPPSSQSLHVDSSFSATGNRPANCFPEETDKADAATSTSPQGYHKHTSTIGTNTSKFNLTKNEVVNQDRSTSTEQVSSQHDKSQQVAVVNVTKASQTSPRESFDILRKDVGILQKKTEEMANIDTDRAAGILPHCSIDDVEIVEEKCLKDFEQPQSLLEDNFSAACPDPCSEKETVHFNTPAISNAIIPSFLAKIGVDSALHLQPSKPVNLNDKHVKSYVFVSLNSCGVDGGISAHFGLNHVSVSPAVITSDEPVWDWQTQVQLPADLLVSGPKRLVFKIWQSEKENEPESSGNPGSADLIGFSALDLTVLSAGLPFISGWYNIMNFAGACHGQIKLSVQPLEDISKMANLSSQISCTDNHSNSSSSMFVAHCTYPEFPSHVIQFPDMRVQKVDPKSPSEALSAIVSNYQLAMERCQKLQPELVNQSQGSGCQEKEVLESPWVSLQQINASTALEVPQGSIKPEENNEKPITSGVGSDPAVLLREKLSELDTMTRCIKSRLAVRVESTISRPQLNQLIMESQRTDKPLNTQANAGGKSEDAVGPDRRRSHEPCVCHFKKENSGKFSEGTILIPKEGSISEDQPKQTCMPMSEERSQKQRKTWERYGDLIDLGSLHISSRDDDHDDDDDDDGNDDNQSPQNADLSDLLSESAFQQVFNPFLFNNILNNMNSSRGVRVIELDDSGTSDDNPGSSAATTQRSESSAVLEESQGMPAKNLRRRSRRGDETYRKETPQSAPHAPSYTFRSGPSLGDADSGVDVDVSANFHSGVFFAASGLHNESFLPRRHLGGGRNGSSEREESSSCSLSSRNRQSNQPSSTSASATPSDSPQHSQPGGGPNEATKFGVLGKRNASACNSGPNRKEM